MKWRSDSKDAIDEHRQARKALEDQGRSDRQAGRRDETDAGNRANSRVIDSEKNVSWWRR